MSAEKSSPPSPERRPGAWRIVFLILGPFLGAFVGVLVAGVLAYVMPKKFESRCVVQIHPPGQVPGVGTSADEGISETVQSSNFLPTEFEVIQSEATLMLVAERLDLPSRWNQSAGEAVSLLQGMVSTEVVMGTDLVSIRVRHVDAEEARDIAKAVAEAYVARRTSIEMERAEMALAALDSELRDQEDLLEEKRKVLYVVAEAIGIPHHQESNELASGLEFSLGAEKELYKLEHEIQKLKVRLAMLRKLKGEELSRYAAALPLPRTGVAALLEEYQHELEKAKELAASGVGANHPQSQALAEVIAEAEEDLAESVETVRVISETELELSEERLFEMRRVVDERRDLALNRALESADYIAAKQDYESAQAMLELMKKMHTGKRIALKLPRQPVTIHEEPREGRAPVSPKIGMILTAGSGVGALLGLAVGLLVFFLPGRR